MAKNLSNQSTQAAQPVGSNPAPTIDQVAKPIASPPALPAGAAAGQTIAEALADGIAREQHMGAVTRLQERRANLQRYVEILIKPSPGPDEIAAMRDLMERLNVSVEGMQQDAKWIARFLQNRAEAAMLPAAKEALELARKNRDEAEKLYKLRALDVLKAQAVVGGASQAGHEAARQIHVNREFFQPWDLRDVQKMRLIGEAWPVEK